MNNDDHYEEKLNQLTNKVNDITTVRQKSFMPTFIPKNINPIYIYIGIPLIIFFILIVAKPKIVMDSIKNDKTFFTESKLSYIKVFCIIMFVIILEVVIYFINNVKKKE